MDPSDWTTVWFGRAQHGLATTGTEVVLVVLVFILRFIGSLDYILQI